MKYKIRESLRGLILGDPKGTVVGVRKSKNGRNKNWRRNLCLQR